MLRHHARFRQGNRGVEYIRSFFRRSPEGMVLRKRKRQERFHRPIGRAGGIVAFADQKIGVSVADGEYTVAVKNRLFRPPAEIAQIVALDLAPWERLYAGEGEGTPEAGMGE